jgi:hypothetical protein
MPRPPLKQSKRDRTYPGVLARVHGKGPLGTFDKEASRLPGTLRI